MDVGNDPFPRDEVTGLAAFENLEPVSSLNVVPQGEEADSVPPESAANAQESDAPPVRNEIQDERRDPTLPLELTVDHLPLDPNEPVDLPYAAQEHAPGGDADHLFDGSHGNGGWGDPDEATRVATAHAHGPATNLQMDWDEDEEPPTQMRPGAMFDAPPLSANTGWDETDSSTTIYDDPDALQEEPDDDEDFDQLPRPSALQTMSGGRPSPFPIPPPSAPIPSLRDFGLSRVAQASAAVLESRRIAPPEPISFVAALRGGDRRAWLLSGGVAVGLIALALIVRGLAGGSSSASVMFATTPSDAKVFVDGKEVPGTASPYSLPDIAAGKHELAVKKDGFKDYAGSFVVARGETKALPSIELVPSVRETGFSVRSTPAGASVWIDGKATDSSTPARMTGVAPGIHRLQLKHPGYSDFELQLFVPDATVLQLPAAELVALAEPAAPAAPQESEPVARSRRSRSSDDDGDLSDSRSSSRWRRSHSSDDGDGSASRSSRSSSSHSSWRSGGSSRSASSAAASSSSSHGSWRNPSPSRAPAPVLTAAAPAAAPIEPTSSGKLGMLRINSRPWAQVFVDGRMVGNTPQQGIPLTPGRHKVQLVNPQMGLKKNVSVSIKAGQVATQVVTLAE